MQKNTIEKSTGNSTIAYCWIVWTKENKPTELMWIPPHVEKYS